MINKNKKILIGIIAAIAGIVLISVIVVFLFNDKKDAGELTSTSKKTSTPSFTLEPTQKPVASDQLSENITENPTAPATSNVTSAVDFTDEPMVTSAPVTANPDILPTVQPTADINYDNSSNVQILLKDSGSSVINNNGGVKVMNNGSVSVSTSTNVSLTDGLYYIK